MAAGPASIGAISEETRRALEQAAEAPAKEARVVRLRIGVLLAAGVAMQALLIAFILLYVNFPAGYNAPYGLSLESVPLFHTFWPYPVLSLEPRTFALSAALTIMALWGIYFVVVNRVRHSLPTVEWKRLTMVAFAFAILFNLTLAVALPPVLSADIYYHALWGRMVALYGLNPYVVPSSAVMSDPLWSFVYRPGTTSHYGPVWTLVSAAAAAIGGQSVLLTVIALKGLAALFNLANCLLVFLLARRLGGDGVTALLLYAWNPLILIETAGSAHKDAVMMTFVLLGLLLAARSRMLAGMVMLGLSMLVKYLTGLLVLLILVQWLVGTGAWRRAARAWPAGAAAAIVGALYLHSGPGGHVVEQLAARTMGMLASYDGDFHSPVRVLLRDGLAGLLSSSGDSSAALATAAEIVRWGLRLGFGLLVLLLVKSAASKKPALPRVLALWGVGSLAYVMLVFSFWFPWYLIPTMTTAFVVSETPLNKHLATWSNRLGVVLMLPYAMLMAV